LQRAAAYYEIHGVKPSIAACTVAYLHAQALLSSIKQGPDLCNCRHRYFTDRLVRACAELPKLCEFFHVPVQSGDDDILRAMKRGYTADRHEPHAASAHAGTEQYGTWGAEQYGT
jgi:hypothetical protein